MPRPRDPLWRMACVAALLGAIVAPNAAGDTLAYLAWTSGLDGPRRVTVDVMNMDTAETRTLVGFELASGLSASRDGRRLVCVTGGRDDNRLTLIDARTGAVEYLPREDDIGYALLPKFSPDGQHLLYNYSKPAGAPSAVKVLDLHTGASTWLTKRGFRSLNPDWSPDGTQIVFAKEPPKRYADLHVMSAEGGETLNLTNWQEDHDDEPAWSPDGTEIAFMRVSKLGRRVAVYDIASGDVRELTDHAFEAFRPTWSPDGQHVVFHGVTVEDADRGRDARNAYSIRRDGTDMRRLTHHEPGAVYPVWVDADLLPVSPRGAAVTTWATLKQQAAR